MQTLVHIFTKYWWILWNSRSATMASKSGRCLQTCRSDESATSTSTKNSCRLYWRRLSQTDSLRRRHFWPARLDLPNTQTHYGRQCVQRKLPDARTGHHTKTSLFLRLALIMFILSVTILYCFFISDAVLESQDQSASRTKNKVLVLVLTKVLILVLTKKSWEFQEFLLAITIKYFDSS